MSIYAAFACRVTGCACGCLALADPVCKRKVVDEHAGSGQNEDNFLSPNSVTSSIEIWHNWRVMNLRSTPLVGLSGVDSELSGGDFSSTPPSPLPASKPILFNRC